MTSHALTNERRPSSPAGRSARNGLLQLGWPHFWLLGGILGGMIALFLAVLFAYWPV